LLECVCVYMSVYRYILLGIAGYYSSLYCLYMELKKNDTNNLFIKQKYSQRHRKQSYGNQRGRGGGKDKLGVWD